MTLSNVEKVLAAARLALAAALSALEERRVDARVVDARRHLDDLLSEFDALRDAVGLESDRLDDVLQHKETIGLLQRALRLRGDSHELGKLQERIRQALDSPLPTPELVTVVRALLVMMRQEAGDLTAARGALRDHYELVFEVATGSLQWEPNEAPKGETTTLEAEQTPHEEDAALLLAGPSSAPAETADSLDDEVAREHEHKRASVAEETRPDPRDGESLPRDVIAPVGTAPQQSHTVNLMAWRFKQHTAAQVSPAVKLSKNPSVPPPTGSEEEDQQAVVERPAVEEATAITAGGVAVATSAPDLEETLLGQEPPAQQEFCPPSEFTSSTSAPSTDPPSIEDERLLGLITSGEAALAYHIATALGCPQEERGLLCALVYAEGVGGPLDEATEAFESVVPDVQLVAPRPASRALQVATSLLPALVGVSSAAVEVLREAQADTQTPVLARNIGRALVRVSDALKTVDVLSALNALPEARDAAERAERKRDLTTQLNKARREWPRRKLRYEGASQVWWAVWSSTGLLGRAFAQAVETQGRVSADWSDADLDHLIDQVRVEQGHNVEQIDGGARKTLISYLRDARDLLHQWNAACGRTSEDYRAVQLSAFLDEWRELSRVIDQRLLEEDTALEAVFLTLTHQFQRANDALNGQLQPPTPASELLRRGLLRMGLTPQDDGTAHTEDVRSGLYAQRAQVALDGVQPWSVLLDTYVREHDFRSAYAVLEMLEEDERIVRRGEVDREAEEVRRGLVRAVAHTRAGLERAIYQGLLSEEQARDLDAHLTDIRQSLDDVHVIRAESVRTALRELEETCAQHAASLSQDLRARLKELDTPEETAAVVERQLQRQDFQTAQEYLGLIEKGEALPTEVPPALPTLLPGAFEKAALLYGQGPRQMVNDASRGLLNFLPHQHSLREERQKSGASLLEQWFNFFNAPTARTVRTLFETLDFTVKEVEADTRLDRLFVVRGPEIRDRRIIPAALFGSQAAGRYLLYVSPRANAGVSQVFD